MFALADELRQKCCLQTSDELTSWVKDCHEMVSLEEGLPDELRDRAIEAGVDLYSSEETKERRECVIDLKKRVDEIGDGGMNENQKDNRANPNFLIFKEFEKRFNKFNKKVSKSTQYCMFNEAAEREKQDNIALARPPDKLVFQDIDKDQEILQKVYTKKARVAFTKHIEELKKDPYEKRSGGASLDELNSLLKRIKKKEDENYYDNLSKKHLPNTGRLPVGVLYRGLILKYIEYSQDDVDWMLHNRFNKEQSRKEIKMIHKIFADWNNKKDTEHITISGTNGWCNAADGWRKKNEEPRLDDIRLCKGTFGILLWMLYQRFYMIPAKLEFVRPADYQFRYHMAHTVPRCCMGLIFVFATLDASAINLAYLLVLACLVSNSRKFSWQPYPWCVLLPLLSGVNC